MSGLCYFCQLIPLKLWPNTAQGCNHNQLACPSYNLYVQLLWYPMYYPRGMKWPWRGSVVVTAYDFESGRPGSNPEWGLLYYEASITAQSLPEHSSLRGSTLGTRAAEHKGCNWGMQVDWWLQPCAVFGHSFSGIGWHICHRNKVNSIAWLYRRAQPKNSILYIYMHFTFTKQK